MQGLQFHLEQKQNISQQMLQMVTILQMSTQELEVYLENFALENPVVELLPQEEDRKSDRAEYERRLEWLERTDYQNHAYYADDSAALSARTDAVGAEEPGRQLSDELRLQLLTGTYRKKELAILDFIIRSIDAHGYYTDGTAVIMERFSVSEQTALRMIHEIQKLEPAGVGAADLRECLLLQLERLQPRCALAEEIVRGYLAELGKHHLKELSRVLKKPLPEIQKACDLIRTLNPRPGNSYLTGERAHYIRPDALVYSEQGELQVLVTEARNSRFQISEFYRSMLQSTTDAEAKKYLREKIAQAQTLARDLEGRSSTLFRVVSCIAEKQKEFFLLGPEHKKPMRLADLSRELELHESTVSRALREKYVQCSWGIFSLRSFLSAAAVGTVGEEEAQTAEQVKTRIRRIVDGEDKKKPLSDNAIQKKLEEDGCHISRRTVNKYRLELGIPDKAGRMS